VCFACVDAEEFRIAQQCGLFVIVEADELEDLVYHYERRGAFEHVVALLETGITKDGAHKGMYTELAILYSKYREEKLIEFLRQAVSKLHTQKVCENNIFYVALVFVVAQFLYCCPGHSCLSTEFAVGRTHVPLSAQQRGSSLALYNNNNNNNNHAHRQNLHTHIRWTMPS
jgi:hypothetical protein